MSAAGVSTKPVDLKARATAARARFEASGVNVSEWARDHGFSERLVHNVLRGNRRCMRGESHRIAVALGLKSEATAPGPIAPPPGAPANLEPAR